MPLAHNDSLDAAPPISCANCGAALAHDQRYCVACGARRGPIPRQIGELIAAMQHPPLGDGPAGDERHSAPETDPALDSEDAPWPFNSSMPTPRVTAVAVMGLLAFGVLVGSAVSPPGASTASTPVIVAVSPAKTPAAAPAPVDNSGSQPASPAPSQPPPQPQVIVQQPPASAPASAPPPLGLPSGPTLPPVKHVFMIVLSNHGYEEAFGPGSPAPFLAKTLTSQGELLPNYYAVAGGELANEIALISGQGPTADTVANCPHYTDITPGTVGDQQQIKGSGCVYPRAATTLPDQLTADGKDWKAYVEDIGNGPADQAKTCRHPSVGASDPNQAPRQGDAYLTWRNPFVYFHSLLDATGCSDNDVGLDRLGTDLKNAATAPALSYIVPNACHDGTDQPCAPGAPAGLAAADSFLSTVVPEIKSSPAYKDGGLIAITFDQAPQSGPHADPSACCQTPPSPYPNLPNSAPDSGGGAAQPPAAGVTGETTTGGGGRVGLLLISPFVKPGTSIQAESYNHFSLLRSIEDLFSLTPLGYASTPALPAFDRTVYTAFTGTG